FGAGLVGLCGGGDVGGVDGEHRAAGGEQVAQHGQDAVELGGRVGVGEPVGAGRGVALGQPQQQAEVGAVAAGERGEDRVGGERVLHEAQAEHLLLAGEDVAQVPHVGAVGQHV